MVVFAGPSSVLRFRRRRSRSLAYSYTMVVFIDCHRAEWRVLDPSSFDGSGRKCDFIDRSIVSSGLLAYNHPRIKLCC